MKFRHYILFALIIFIHLILYLSFNKYVNLKSELILSEKKIINHPDSIRYLFLGDSHTARAVNTEEIPAAYNSSYYGEKNIYTYYKLKYFLEEKKITVPVLILPADITCFMPATAALEKNGFYYAPFVNYDELGKLAGNRFHYFIIWFRNTFFPYLELRTMLQHTKKEKIKKGNKSLSENSTDKNQERTNNFLNKLTQNGQNHFSDLSLKYLKKTITLCKEKNIRIVFIKYPMSRYFAESGKKYFPEYIAGRNPAEEIIMKCPDCTLLDFQNIFLNNDDYFFDSHHLNLKGREKFTEILKEKLNSMQNAQ